MGSPISLGVIKSYSIHGKSFLTRRDNSESWLWILHTLVYYNLPPQKNVLEDKPGPLLPHMSLASPGTGSAFQKPHCPDLQQPQRLGSNFPSRVPSSVFSLYTPWYTLFTKDLLVGFPCYGSLLEMQNLKSSSSSSESEFEQDPQMLHSSLRLEKHWSCPFLDKASTNSKGNKFTPLYLSLWFPSPCIIWTSVSKSPYQHFLQFHLASAASSLSPIFQPRGS